MPTHLKIIYRYALMGFRLSAVLNGALDHHWGNPSLAEFLDRYIVENDKRNSILI